MAGTFTICAFLLEFLWITHEVTGFNLDTAIPIVKDGVSGSYFGFSVAQHQIYQINQGLSKHVFIVGAPKDNITDPTAPLQVQQLKRPGAVYTCPISSFFDDCTMINIDWDVPAGSDDKNDQWMGVTVGSQGTREGIAVACAHRYKTFGPSYVWGLGICVTMSNSLDEEDYLEPCASRSTSKGHGEYGYCQAGTSFDFDKDGTYLIGSPGPYNWRGSVWKNLVPYNLSFTAEWYWNALENLDPTKPVETQPPAPPVPYYANLGMSVKISRILGKPTYVGGAPRSRYTGEVLLFTQNNRDFGGSQKYLDVTEIHHLTGEQFGSNFGHSLAVVDLNMDGLEDLVVGAPFYQAEGIGGAIYIYMNGPGSISKETIPQKITSRKMMPQECRELDCTNARFGYALEDIGDVDQDGYHDLAVGAPYEGNGVVYIFRGSANGISEEFSQRIVASDLQRARPLGGFGYSLSGGNDMDNNGYPDLVVGAYNSDKSIVLLARPVINIIAEMTTFPVVIDPEAEERCKEDGRPNKCFKVNICFRFTAEPVETFNERIGLDYTLEAEKFTGRLTSRVTFSGAEREMPNKLQRTVTLFEQTDPRRKCRPHIAYIMKNNRDFLNPINLRLSWKLKEQPPPTMNVGSLVPDMNSFPVLNDAAAKTDLAVDFMKNCGVDKKCQSDLKVRSKFVGLDLDDEGDAIYKLGLDRELKLYIDVQNKHTDDAHDSILTLLHPANVSYVNIIQDDTSEVRCEPYEEKQTVVCSIGNPMKGQGRVSFTMRLDARGLSSTHKQLEFKLRVNTTSEEVDEQDDTLFLILNVVSETDLLLRGRADPKVVYYGGVVRGESAIKEERQIGDEVRHIYEVKNTGRSRVANSTVVIHWPYEYEIGYPQGKHLLYLVQYPIVESPVVANPGRCYVDDKMVDPLNIRERGTPSIESLRRVRRNIKPPPRPEYRQEADGSVVKIATLNCTNGYAKCFNFSCVIGDIMGGEFVYITIVSRLWNSTFLEDFRTYDRVLVQSHGMLKIDSALNIKQTNLDNDMAVVTTQARADIHAKEPKQVPIWVWFLAAFGGLLLLILLIILLWKCGFFKRKRPDDMQRHQGKVQKKKKMYYEDEYN